MRMKKTMTLLGTIFLTCSLSMAGCGGTDTKAGEQSETIANTEDTGSAEISDDADAGSDEEAIQADGQEAGAETETVKPVGGQQAADEGDTKGQVAAAGEMAQVLDVGDESLTPVAAEALKDGTYPVKVDSSSTMFQIRSCDLIVGDGQMRAVMTMGGTGYLYVFMGTGEEAVEADEAQYISYEENENGEHTFTVPLKALNQVVECTAYSRKKEKWYDRQLLFRADSLPMEAFAQSGTKSVLDLGLADGNYTVEVQLGGGSGRASVESPAKLVVEDGKAFATIVFSSKNYDYMLVDGGKYENTNSDGNSTFIIPVEGFDANLSVVGDTTAMSTPHEIDYTLYFTSDSIRELE